MNDVAKFESLRSKAEAINRKIAAMEGARDEIKKQLDGLNAPAPLLEETIQVLESEIAKLQEEIKAKTSKLEADVASAEAVLNS